MKCCYSVGKAAASHLTRMLGTRNVRCNIPVRVVSIAPGVFESELTGERIRAQGMEAVIPASLQPVSVPPFGLKVPLKMLDTATKKWQELRFILHRVLERIRTEMRLLLTEGILRSTPECTVVVDG